MPNVQMPKMDMPDMAELMASLFGGGDSSNKKGASRKAVDGPSKKNR